MSKFMPEKNGEKWELKCMCVSDYAGDKEEDKCYGILRICVQMPNFIEIESTKES